MSSKVKESSKSKVDINELRETAINFVTRSSAFKKLCKYVFKICDVSKTGSLNSTELYAGVLLVHLQMAKYAGAAACYPASRAAVEELFLASDGDNSGGIDEDEFETIMIITAASISSRILTYYAVLIIVVPFCANIILSFMHVDENFRLIDSVVDKNSPTWMRFWINLIPDSFWLSLPETIISLAFFFFIIPKIVDTIDKWGKQTAERTVVMRKAE